MGSSVGSNYSYSWSGQGLVSGANSLQPTVNQGGLYTLVVTDNQNGCTAISEVFVSENTNVPAGLDVLIDPPLCFGDRGSIEVLEVLGGTPPYLYSFDQGETFYEFNIFSNLNPGSYSILVQDAIGCEYEEYFDIPYVPELLVDLGADIIVELGDNTSFNAIVNIPISLIDTIAWSPDDSLSCTDCLNPTVYNPLFETVYQITVTDLNGCSAQDQIILRVKKDRDVFIPNVFSPHNQDGINDIFMIFSGLDEVENIDKFQIFDRWGELVFEDYDFLPNDPAHGWDGFLRGEPMNPAVFVYWAEITFIDGVTILYKGDVTLVR